jgi:uncharacterized protein (TIGR02246 family)
VIPPHNVDVEAELAVRHLTAAYADAVNRKCPEDAASLWVPDGVLVFRGRQIVGRDTILKAYRRTFSEFHLMFQMFHTSLVVVEGDRARTRWWVSDFTQPQERGPYEYGVGIYQDEVVRIDEGWRFTRRRFDSIRSGRVAFEQAMELVPLTILDLR